MPKKIIYCRKCKKPFFNWESQTAGLCSRECYNKERQDHVFERFWAKVEKTDSCWIWKGAKSSNGYGHFKSAKYSKSNYIPISAHRFSYEILVGKIPEGLTLDHLCRNRSCVNPAHLEPVTIKENNLRGISPAALNAKKTYCPKGHKLSGDNLYPRNNRRHCRACRKENDRRRYAKLYL